jgi:hypothetical protein
VNVAAPPSRQPRGSSATTSRDAAPTTSTIGDSALRAYSLGPRSSPNSSESEPPFVLL